MSKEQKLKDTYFHVDWLFHEDFKDCDAQVKGNDTKYRCKVCCKSRSLSYIDITVLKKHMKIKLIFFVVSNSIITAKCNIYSSWLKANKN